MTTKATLQEWFERGQATDASVTHMIVVCDTFDYEDYPVYVKAGEDASEAVEKHSGNMQKVMEVYSYGLPLEGQLAEFRAYHL